MNITKFTHACVQIETNGKNILVDGGKYSLEAEKSNWNPPDFVFITHKHSDHFDEEFIKTIAKENTRFFATSETAKAYPNTTFEIVKEGDEINLGEIKVRVTKAIHGYLPGLKHAGKEVFEGAGYVFELEEKKVYLVGDSICFDSDVKCDVLFVPVCNHGLVMGPFEAAAFAKETGATVIVPYHYDSPNYPADMDRVKREFEKIDLGCKILSNGESFEI
ncbi:MAG: MBL fold metallo-hydrolase [Candidatus Diapherotrites archaeon]|jgi:L-ascorbate metabolism protein UlaG (beta-lactamase superfamily)|nr:MBL fold metallo-hydrolase [Candidatus Diapherotrites archaeon]MBT4597145.1 MBL fold metallo-hydrolase [Candidatus Diapherotrites archaeon]